MGIAPQLWARNDDEEEPVVRRASPTFRLSNKEWEQMGEFVAVAIEPLRKRIEELEAKQLTFAGVWKAGEMYPENALVTKGGSMWHSKMPRNTTTPGDGLAWRLVVKRGRDGRDSK
jgi:hypothetical protein